MQHLPLFADLRQRRCLVVGGGEVAERKVALLSRAAPDITLIAPALSAQLRQWTRQGVVRWLPRRFQASDVDGMHLVIAATGDGKVNQAVASAAAAADCLVNVVDQPHLSNFISPAIVDRSPLVIAISSGGTMPVLARRVRSWLENLLPANVGDLAVTAGRWRSRVAQRLPDLLPRRHFWERVLDLGLLAGSAPDRLIESTLEAAAPATGTADLAGTGAVYLAGAGAVYLVGAGPGDPDLLTLKAARILQQADVILYDRLVTPAVLERARRDARFIDVGKQAGDHRFSQLQINQLLIKHARRGQLVCRLKGGDPGLFGRAAEEISALRDAGIEVHLVPGITAAQGCAAAAGFSLTDRHTAHSLLLATAHGADDAAAAAVPVSADQTAVFYMPVKTLPQLRNRLLMQGLEGTTPCALIENGTRTNQRVIRGDLRYIDQIAAQAAITSPALLVVGRVVENIDHKTLASDQQSARALETLAALNAA